MRYMPDSAVLGTIGHAKRRNAIARKRNARRNARLAEQNITFGNYVAAVVTILGAMLFVGLFL